MFWTVVKIYMNTGTHNFKQMTDKDTHMDGQSVCACILDNVMWSTVVWNKLENRGRQEKDEFVEPELFKIRNAGVRNHGIGQGEILDTW